MFCNEAGYGEGAEGGEALEVGPACGAEARGRADDEAAEGEAGVEDDGDVADEVGVDGGDEAAAGPGEALEVRAEAEGLAALREYVGTDGRGRPWRG